MLTYFDEDNNNYNDDVEDDDDTRNDNISIRKKFNLYLELKKTMIHFKNNFQNAIYERTPVQLLRHVFFSKKIENVLRKKNPNQVHVHQIISMFITKIKACQNHMVLTTNFDESTYAENELSIKND